jgi:hypothetical protein
MANTSKINGFKPVKHLNGSPYNGQFNLYEVVAADATAIFVGDLVRMVAATSTTGLETVGVVATTEQTTGSGLVGAVVGFKVENSVLDGNLSGGAANQIDTPVYRAALTKRLVMVADSPDLVFEVQDGGTVPCTQALIGSNTGYTIGSGSTTTGVSAATTGATVPATTVTLPLKVLGFVQRPDNEHAAASQKLLVKINVHAYGSMGTNVS